MRIRVRWRGQSEKLQGFSVASDLLKEGNAIHTAGPQLKVVWWSGNPLKRLSERTYQTT